MSSRTNRVGDLLRAEISTILLRDLKDPRVKLASVTSVDVTRDIGSATVLVSVLGDSSAQLDCIEALQNAAGYIRSQLAKRVHLRTVPNLTFTLDRGAEHSQKMFELLENLNDDSIKAT